MEFEPDCQADFGATQELVIFRDRLRHEDCVNNSCAQSKHVVELEPSTFESPLPSMLWFEALPWDDLRNLSGTTFVQVPRRFESVFCEALGCALIAVTKVADDSVKQQAGWKAVLFFAVVVTCEAS
jgi:hypothetical protein